MTLLRPSAFVSLFVSCVVLAASRPASGAEKTNAADGLSTSPNTLSNPPAPVAAPTPPREPATSRADRSSARTVSEAPLSNIEEKRGMDAHWSVSPLLGFSTNGLNAGFGLRGGRTLANHVYVGGTFVYNIGESTSYFPYAGYADYTVQYGGVEASASSSLFYAGPEGGYDIDLKYVVLRPYVGLGIVHASVRYSSSVALAAPVAGVIASGSNSWNGFGLWPGASVMYAIPRTIFFVGGDLRLLIPTGSAGPYALSGSPALGFFGFAGANFGS